MAESIGSNPDTPVDDHSLTTEISKDVLPLKVLNLNILHVEEIPIKTNYENIVGIFGVYGTIKEVRMNLNRKKWEAWISFSKCEDAFKASCDISKLLVDDNKIKGALCDHIPFNMEVYIPGEWHDQSSGNTSSKNNVVREPNTPKWIVVNGNEERYNYYKLSKYIQRKVGSINSKNISRYGRNSILIHASSDTQSYMLCNLKIVENDMVKDVKQTKL